MGARLTRFPFVPPAQTNKKAPFCSGRFCVFGMEHSLPREIHPLSRRSRAFRSTREVKSKLRGVTDTTLSTRTA